MTSRAELILNLRGSLDRGLREIQRQFERTGTIGQRSIAALDRSVGALANRYTALATGAGAVAAGAYVVSHQRRLTRLANTASLTAQELRALNDEIYRTAQQADARVDPGEILAAMEGIVEKTGDLAFARDNLRNIALALQATGASGQAIGELAAEIQKLGETDPKKVLQLLDTLNVQGKEGAFTLENLAALGPRVITAYAGSVKGQRDSAQMLREMGAALQVIRQGTGSAEQAATAFERLLAELQMADKQKLFRKLGVQIFELGADGERYLRPVNELMLEFMAATRGDRLTLGGLFGDEAIRAFNALDPAAMERYMSAQGDGAATMRDSARAAQDAAGALQNLSTAWRQFADVNLTPVIQDAADALNSVDPETLQVWGEMGKRVLIVGGGLLALRKIFQLSRGIAGIFGAGGRSAGGAAGALGGAGGALGGVPIPLPVYVMNDLMSLLPTPGGPPGAPPPGGPPGPGRSRLATAARGAAGLGLSAGAGYLVGTGIYELGLAGTRVGDAIGAGIARVLAAFGNDEAQASIASMRESAAILNGTLRIEVDGPARVRSATTSQPGVDMDVHSGMAGAPS